MTNEVIFNSDEILEIIWMLKEKNINNLEAVKKDMAFEGRMDELNQMVSDGLIKIENDSVTFSAKGEEQAKKLIRRHRLAERLLVDVLESRSDELETSACQFEHILDDDIVDNICTLLGHPQQCPHELSIPSGKCCLRAKNIVESIIMPLSKLDVGEKSVIAYILTKKHPQLHKLMSFGILPGVSVKVHQKSPSYVINVGEMQVALEKELLENIYIRKRLPV